MTATADVIALHQIGSARNAHGLVEEILGRVIANRDVIDARPVAGMLDIDYLRLDGARTKLASLDARTVEAIAGSEASASVTALREVLYGIEEPYGLACGFDRTPAQAEALRALFTEAAESALAHLMAYWREVGGLEIPPLADYVEALERTREERPPAQPGAARSPAPRIRAPLDGSVTAPRARMLLGVAFGTIAGVHIRIGIGDRRTSHVGAVVDLTGLSASIATRAHNLAGRMRAVDHDIGEELTEAAAGIDALDECFQDSLGDGDVTAEAFDALRAKALACVKDVGTRIRRIERLAALRGYDMERDAPAAAPTP